MGAHEWARRPDTTLGPPGLMPSNDVVVPSAGARLGATLSVPDGTSGLVVFAHGSGSSRHSPRNRAVAEVLWRAGIATLLLDLLSGDEERDRSNVFDVELLARRVVGAIEWAREDDRLASLPVGLFGASTGAAAALVAAATPGTGVAAVVSRGGRPDLAGEALARVRAPTLLVVGGRDEPVLALNQQAARRLGGPHEVCIVPGATHLFEEPGTLDTVAAVARDFFLSAFDDTSGESASRTR